MNMTSIENHIRAILQEIGENPSREGLVDTPKRVAKMYTELFRGYDKSQKPVVTTFPNGVDGVAYDEMVMDFGSVHSQCEHHMLPFSGQYWFGYIPSLKGRVLGLSKVARVVDYFAAKLQIQERLVHEIVTCLLDALSKNGAEPPLGLALVIRAEHLCKTMRGVKKQGVMTTSKMTGLFLDKDDSARHEFLSFVSKDI